MNNSIIYGTITREIILQNERAVLNVQDEKTLADGTVKKNNWLVITFRSLAERCKACLTVGSKVVVSGSFEARAYKDEYGIDRWTTELYAREVVFVDADDLESEKEFFENLGNIKTDAAESSESKSLQKEPPAQEDESDDVIKEY